MVVILLPFVGGYALHYLNPRIQDKRDDQEAILAINRHWGGQHMAFTALIAHDMGLKLTDDQFKQIEPILKETAEEVSSANRDCGRKVRDIFMMSRKKMALYLTPTQIAALEALQKRDDEFFKRHDKRAHPGPPHP